MVRFRETRRSIRTHSQIEGESSADRDTGQHVHIGRINRNRYPKLKAWYFVIILFLGLMYLIAKTIVKLW